MFYHSTVKNCKTFCWKIKKPLHLIKCSTIWKLNSRELNHMLLLLKYDKPTCEGYHEKKFDECSFLN